MATGGEGPCMGSKASSASDESSEDRCLTKGGGKKKRFAILLCGHGSAYARKQYGGVPGLFQRMLSEPGETWDTYRVVDGDFPSDSDLEQYDAFVVTGSCCDAHGDDPWVLRLCELLRCIHRVKRKKLLGICFGHQVICRALGGKTGRATNGWECGLKAITLADAMSSMRYWHPHLPSTLRIMELHQDEVFEIPDGGQVLASSTTTTVEMYGVREEVLGIQGHPEITEDIMLYLLNSTVRNIVPAKIIERGVLSLEQGRADHKCFELLCKSFLKGKMLNEPHV